LKSETRFNDSLLVGCSRITSPLDGNIAEFVNCSREPEKAGVLSDRDLTFKFNQKPYINACIFFDQIKTIVLPYIDTLRGLAVLTREVAALLMDNSSAHVNDDLICILSEANMRVITIAPHATHVFQILDLTLFGVLKRCPRYELPFDDDNATVKVIMKVYHDFRQTMIRPNI
jgi:hypothetical protein